jgi:hypothetical protein
LAWIDLTEKAMGGEPEGSAAEGVKGGSSAMLHVWCSNGNKFAVEVDLGATVLALKGLLVERTEIPADQQLVAVVLVKVWFRFLLVTVLRSSVLIYFFIVIVVERGFLRWMELCFSLCFRSYSSRSSLL